jgi:ligand-binding SRPBCC domain-containing protein
MAADPMEVETIMKEFTLKRIQLIKTDLDTVFDFFASARNLEMLTPPWLTFEVLTPDPIEMKIGTRIDYRLKLHRIPLRWQSEITAWEPGVKFVDEQRRGPYRYWVHTHTFEQIDKGVLVRDDVRYAVTGGSIIQKLFVAPDLEQIWSYRAQKLMEVFTDRAVVRVS